MCSSGLLMLVGDGKASVCTLVWLPKIVDNPAELIGKFSAEGLEHWGRQMCQERSPSSSTEGAATYRFMTENADTVSWLLGEVKEMKQIK